MKLAYHSRQCNNNKGFSLIEIIMVLVLLGIVGALSSVGITSFIKTFITTKESNKMISDGQIAILRIAKELIAVDKLYTCGTPPASPCDNSTSTQIKFTTKHNDSDYTFKIYTINNSIHLAETSPGSFDDILANSVESLEFQYYAWNSDNTTNPFQEQASPTWTDDRCDGDVKINQADYNTNDQKIYFQIESTVDYGHFQIMYDDDNSTHTTTTSGKEKANIHVDISTGSPRVCDYAYIYAPNRTGKTSCLLKLPIHGHSFTSKTDLSCYQLPKMSTISGQTITRIIKVTLKMSGINELSIMVIPRNIYQ